MKARNLSVLIGSQVLVTIGSIVAFLIALLFMSDLLSTYDAAAKLITLLLLGAGFFILGSSAASYVIQVSMLPLSIAFLIASAIGSFILLPMTDVLSMIIAASVSVFPIILIGGITQVGKKSVNMYTENTLFTKGTVYCALAIEIIVATTIIFYIALSL
ncbi:hypothetical protein LCGC14_2622600 [marine sediment metagenome]|uniref:Uncharacterized protein n=1 Tax=marine sediment metagenome TaxID=412755 RepID=A0A0F9CDQ1_9ZZZZ